MKKYKKCACGREIKYELVSGYMSAADCGRPRGAKGMDTSYVRSFCECGDLREVEVIEEEWFDLFDFSEIEKKFDVRVAGIGVPNTRPEIEDKWGNYISFVPADEPMDWELFISSIFEEME